MYSNAEDFFFRTVHLGTECWMFAANALASYGAEHAANGAWHVAAARTALVRAAGIIDDWDCVWYRTVLDV